MRLWEAAVRFRRPLSVCAIGALLAAPSLWSPGSAGTADEAVVPFEPVAYAGGVYSGLAASGERIYVGIGSRLAVLTARQDALGLLLRGVSEPLPETVRGLASIGPTTVVASGASGLYTFDVSEVEQPRRDTYYSLGEPPLAIAAGGDTCVVLEESSFRTFQLDGGGELEEVGWLEQLPAMHSPAKAVVGDGVALLGGTDGRRIGPVVALDIDDPANPFILGGIDASVAPMDLAASGRLLYVLEAGAKWVGGVEYRESWIHAMSVAPDGDFLDHGRVNVVPQAPGAFYGRRIAARGSQVFVTGATTQSDASEQRELRCWDFTDPVQPTATCIMPMEGYADDLVVAGDRLYAGAQNFAIADGAYTSPVVTAADISDAVHPSWRDRWQFGQPGRITAVATSGADVIYSESAGHTHIYDGHRPDELVAISYLDVSLAGPGLLRLVADERSLYVLDRGVTIFDIADRRHPAQAARGDNLTAGQVLPAMAVLDPYVMVADGKASSVPPDEPGYRLAIFQRGGDDRAGLPRVGEVVAGAFVDDVSISDRNAYVVYREYKDTAGALMVVDWSDPTTPVVVSRYVLADGASAKRVLVRDGYAYVVAKETDDVGTTATALWALDVTHPKDIDLVGNYRAPRVGAEYEPVARGQHYVLGLIGGYALIAGHEPIIRVVDVSDPQTPTEVQQLLMTAVVTDLAVSDPYAYVVLEDGESVILRRTSEQEPGRQMAVYLPLMESVTQPTH